MSISERERTMVFPNYYFFAERRLVNHGIEKNAWRTWMVVNYFATWTTIVLVLTSKKIIKIMKQFTSVN